MEIDAFSEKRLFIAGVAVIVVGAGLVLTGGSSDPVEKDLRMHNQGDERINASINLYRNGRPQANTLEKQLQLEPNETAEFENATEIDETYELAVFVSDGPHKVVEITRPADSCFIELQLSRETVRNETVCT